MHPPLRLGGFGTLEFWGLFFGGVGVGQNIFGFKGVGYISLGESGSFSPFTHFEMLDLKISKNFACGTFISNIHIFRFTTDAGLQVDTDFNTESKFSFLRSSFFSPLSGNSKPTKPMKLLSFLFIWWL